MHHHGCRSPGLDHLVVTVLSGLDFHKNLTEKREKFYTELWILGFVVSTSEFIAVPESPLCELTALGDLHWKRRGEGKRERIVRGCALNNVWLNVSTPTSTKSFCCLGWCWLTPIGLFNSRKMVVCPRVYVDCSSRRCESGS